MRYYIAQLLDKMLKDYCWVELYFWAIDGKASFWKVFNKDNFIQACKKGKEGYPYAYCNKCELNGNYYKDEVIK